MKIVVKQFVMAAVVALMSVPAVAAEQDNAPRSMTKGTKTYQSAKAKTTDDTVAAKTDGDVSQIEPAAGDQVTPEKDGKSFKEEMRLPRKN